MYIKFKDDKVYLSKNLAKEANLKAGDYIFCFKLKDVPQFGFHKATKAQSEEVICDYIRTNPFGELYFTPKETNPVRYMAAVMRLSYKNRRKLKISKQPLNSVDMFIWKK